MFLKSIFFILLLAHVNHGASVVKSQRPNRALKLSNIGDSVSPSVQASITNSQPQPSSHHQQMKPTNRQDVVVDETPAELRSSPNVFFGANDQPLFKIMDPHFKNIPVQYIGPNYSTLNNKMISDGFNHPHSGLADMTGILESQPMQQSSNSPPPKEDTINDMFENTLKKYDVKRFLLKKILGNSHDLDEDEAGFFSNKHLKRHGTAGVAAKVIGELIGIKIRESIEGLGKSFSEYAKDFTARNFVNLGQLFSRVFRPVQVK